jgi:hypothetical protein
LVLLASYRERHGEMRALPRSGHNARCDGVRTPPGDDVNASGFENLKYQTPVLERLLRHFLPVMPVDAGV